MVKSLLKHSAIYLTGLVFSKILTTIVWVLLARIFLPSLFGQIVFYLTLIQLTTYFANFGLVQWYQKKLEDHGFDRSNLFNKILNVRLWTLVVSFLPLTIVLAADQSLSLVALLLILATLISEALLAIGDGFFLEQKKIWRVSLKSASTAVIILLGLPFYYRPPYQLEKAIFVLFLAELLTAGWFFPWKELKHFFFLSLAEIFSILRSSLEYAFLIFSSFFYARGDHLIIGALAGSYALGLYSSAYRYLEALALIPTALSHNLFPLSAKKDGVSSHSMFRIIGLMTISGLIVSVSLFFLSRFLILNLIGPAYTKAVQPLQIFSGVIFLFFVNAPLSTVVQSSNLLKKFLPYGIVNTILNLILNFIFVPQHGIVAAAWVMLITEITGLFINLYFIKVIYSPNKTTTLY